MEEFNISADDLFAQFLSYSSDKKKLKCAVLFPDETIIENATVFLLHSAMISLEIPIHGVLFQEIISERTKDLKFKILEEKPVKQPAT